MSSKSSKASTLSIEEITQDMGTLIRKHDTLRAAHKRLAENTGEALNGMIQLDDLRIKAATRDSWRITGLALALIVQAVYLIIFL